MNIWKETNLCNDFSYFCENYIKIYDYKLGVTPFCPYDYQKRMVKYLEKNQYLMCKKFRQGGFTTLINVYLLWKCLFNQNIKTCSIFNMDRNALWFSDRFKHIINELPNWMKSKIEKFTDHEIKFTTNSKMFFLTSKMDPSRGTKIDYAVFDECAFWEEGTAENWWSAFCHMPIEKAFFISTSSGKKGWFYNTYEDAQNGNNKFKIFNCSYTEHPDYANQEWEEDTKNNLGVKFWKREVLGIDN